MLDIDVNAMIWRIFTSATAEAAVHLGQVYQDNLRTDKNTDFDKVKPLFDISKLSLNQKDEIFGMSRIEWNTFPWMRRILLHDRAGKLSKAKVHVYSVSVLCRSKIHEHPHSIDAWKGEDWVVHEISRIS